MDYLKAIKKLAYQLILFFVGMWIVLFIVHIVDQIDKERFTPLPKVENQYEKFQN